MTRQEILRACADRYGLTIEQMRQKHRKNVIGTARQAAMYEMRAAEAWTLGQIANFLGVDKATIIHGADQHAIRYGLPLLARQPPPEGPRRRKPGAARIAHYEGNIDGFRWGRVWIGKSQLNFRFDRLTGSVRLFRNDVEGGTPMIEIDCQDRIELARLACVEKFGVVA